MALRTPKRRSVQHFTHIHPLTEFDSIGDFICDGCKTYGSGKRYRCEPCHYDLHECCATCPLTLSIFIHPQHELSLVVREQQSTRQNKRACDICDESVEGLFYRCKICEFDVHPLCTQLPQHVRRVLHPAHHLEIQHFTHIHPLTKVDECDEFLCDGCKTYGFGETYRCDLCDYNLHDHCATCTSTLLSFMHPEHELRLVFKGPEETQKDKRMCNICDESAEGLYYQCEPCGFDVHPICTQLPQHVKHVPHSAHLLELSHTGARNTCMVCSEEILSWRYKCVPCGVDVHMECVNTSGLTAEMDTWEKCHGSQVQVRGSGKHRARMYRLLKNITLGVLCNIIASPFSFN